MTLLTPHQKFFSYRNTLNLYNNFIIAARSPCLLKTTEIEQALDSLIRQRILLRCNVNLKDYTLRELPELKARDCYEVVSEPQEEGGLDDGQDALLRALMTIHEKYKFDLGTYYPLWKLFLYKDWIIVALDHTLYDGTTGAAILNDLFLLLQGKEIEEEEDIDIVNMKYEEFLDVSFWQIGKVYFQMVLKPKMYKYIQDFLNFNQYYKNNDWLYIKGQEERLNRFKSLNHLISIPYPKIKNTLRILKTKNVSFQTLLNYITIRTFKTVAPNNSIKFTIPLNMRKFLNIPSSTYGLFVSQTTIPITPSVCNVEEVDPDWRLLSHLENYLSLTNQLQRKSLIAALKYHDGETESKHRSRSMKATHSTSIEYSNLRAPSNEWIDEWIFSQTADDFSTLMPCSVISNEKVTNITMVGHIAMAKDDLFDKFCQEFEKDLEEVVGFFDQMTI